MRTCDVYGCKTKEPTKIAIYSLPADPELRQTWVTNMKIVSNKKKQFVCALHFKDEFVRTSDYSDKQVLDRRAVPTLNAPEVGQRKKRKRRAWYDCSDDEDSDSQGGPSKQPKLIVNPGEFKKYHIFSYGINRMNNIDEPTLVRHTGFTFRNFQKLFNFIEGKQPIKEVSYMSKRDQLLLTLNKYKQNLEFTDIGRYIIVSEENAEEIVKNVTRNMTVAFKRAELWNRDPKPHATYKTILGSTSFRWEKGIIDNNVTNLFLLDTYSVKKCLVGCNEDGMVNFISNVEATSFKNAIQKNRYFGTLKSGDFVSISKDLDVYVALKEKGLAVHTRGDDRYSEFDYTQNIIDGVIKKAKQMAILHTKFPNNLSEVMFGIVFNCLFLTNFQLSSSVQNVQENDWSHMEIKTEIETEEQPVIKYVNENELMINNDVKMESPEAESSSDTLSEEEVEKPTMTCSETMDDDPESETDFENNSEEKESESENPESQDENVDKETESDRTNIKNLENRDVNVEKESDSNGTNNENLESQDDKVESNAED